MTFSPNASDVYRTHVTKFVPSSGYNEPSLDEIRALLAQYEAVMNAFTSAGGLIYDTRALLYADLAKSANSLAWVVDDPTAAFNGVYMKVGGAGAGSWERAADLPYSFIVAEDAGAGSANAIEAASDLPISSSALVLLNIFETNGPGPVTVRFNGAGPVYTIKTNTGNDPADGGLLAGMRLLGTIDGSDFRLVSDQASAAIVAAAEAAQAAAEAAAASLNLPPILPGDAGKTLVVKADESGYQHSPRSDVASRTAMKAITAIAAGQICYLTEAGREGTFILRAGSPPVSDTQEGIYVVSNTAGFYWERVFKGDASARWFGAKGDGVTNDTTAIQAALNVCGCVILPFTSAGYLAGGLVLSSGMVLKGEYGAYRGSDVSIFRPLKSWIKIATGSAFAVKINAFLAGNFTRVESIQFDGGTTSASAIRMAIGTGTVYGVRLRDLSFIRCVEAIGDEVPLNSTTWVHDLEAEEIYCGLTRGLQIFLRQSNGFILFRSVKIEHQHNGSQITWSSARFEKIAGLELDRFDVLGSGTTSPTYNSSVIAIAISGGAGLDASVWLNRVLVDYTHGYGVYIENVYNVVSDAMGVHLTLGDSLTLVNVTKSRFSKTSVYGAKDTAGRPASMNGIRMVSCSDNLFSETFVQNCTGAGVVLTDCLRNGFDNTTCRDNLGNGFVELGTSDRNIKSKLFSFSNGGSSLVQVGAASAAISWIPNTGTYQASTVGPATA